ncbi:MAG: hypothetical protein ACOY0T_06150 [Myxococcota bacterium]
MPETKPREPQSSVPEAADGGSSNRDSSAPAGSDENDKRRMFQQWVASVRPKAPTGSRPSNSAPRASSAPLASPAPLSASTRDSSPQLSISSSSPPGYMMPSNPPAAAPSSNPPPAAGHAISSRPPSLFPQLEPQRESDSTQLYQKVPADLLRKARHISTPPPPTPQAKSGHTGEDPWAVADERTAVFAPPPELLASVRAAAASAGLLPEESNKSGEVDQEARVTAEFAITDPVAPRPEDAEVTKVGMSPALEPTETPLAAVPREALASTADADADAEFRPRRRWPWAIAALLIAGALAGLAARTHVLDQLPHKSHGVR